VEKLPRDQPLLLVRGQKGHGRAVKQGVGRPPPKTQSIDAAYHHSACLCCLSSEDELAEMRPIFETILRSLRPAERRQSGLPFDGDG
jgi:hypothetical protein